MTTIDERSFEAMYNDATKLDGEDLTDSFIRIYTTNAIKKKEITSIEELEEFIDAGFQERHINPSTEDVERIKSNMVRARLQELSREAADIIRFGKKDDENAKSMYNRITRELTSIRKDPDSFFKIVFGKGKERK